MPINVQTGGPIGGSTGIIVTEYSFSYMIERIADDIDDTTGEYADQIRAAIIAAIRYCERNPYYFNETRDITFPTVDGQEFYGAADNANIPTVPGIQAVYTEDSAGQRTYLRRETPEALELLSDNSASRGEPYAYTYFNRQLRLYPIPNQQVWTVRLQVGPYRLNMPTTEDDTGVWFTQAFDMVKARAKYILAKDTLKDATVAAEALNDYNDQRSQLDAETSRRSSRGYITVTCF